MPRLNLLRVLIHRLIKGSWRIDQKHIIVGYRRNTWLLGPEDSLIDICLFDEPKTEKLVFKLVKENNISSVLNIGAHIGAYAVPLAKRGLNVYAIEPNPISITYLVANAKLNNATSNLTIIDKAVCQSYKTKLCISAVKSGSSSIVEFNRCLYEIPVDCLSDLNQYKADLAIIDVEGAELEVAELLPKNIKYIVIEVRDKYLNYVVKLFQNNGYYCKIIERLIRAKNIYNIFCYKIK